MSVSNYREQIRQAVAATVFHSPTWFSWFGQEAVKIPASILRALSADEVRSLILMALQLQLYEDFYCPGMALAPADFVLLHEIQTYAFGKQLRAANQGRGYVESGGWKITYVRGNKITLEREGLRLSADTSELMCPRESLRVGATAALRSRQVLPALSPGFHMTVGDKDWPLNSTKPLNRFYWNLSAPGAVPFVRAVTSVLNGAKLPFRVKVANHPTRFQRCDAGVVYLPTNNYKLAENLIARIYAAIAQHLKRGTPALTKELLPGLGWAEDPGVESFGLSRCSLIAEGMLRARERDKTGLTDRLNIVEAQFDEAGVSLERPFLNPGSRAGRAFDGFCDQVGRASRESSPARKCIVSARIDADTGLFLQAAQEIGRQLVAEALWDRARCNWLEAMPHPPKSNEPFVQLPHQPLGPGFGSGTGGIALFLAELSAITGDLATRQTAFGAIRNSLSSIDAMVRKNRMGLHDGFVGIALAASRVGSAAQNDGLLKRTSRLLKRTLPEFRTTHSFNSVEGNAEAISGLLAIRRILPEKMLLSAAVRLGDSLLKAARNNKTIRRSSFGSADKLQRLPNGFSEEHSQMAHALLELFSVTRNVDYGRAALRLIANEEKSINEGTRSRSRRRSPRNGQFHEPTYVGNEISRSPGAPAVALARIRAYEVLREEKLKSYAAPGIRSAQKILEHWLRVGRGDLSLARGIAGNAEVLLRAREAFGSPYEPDRTLAIQVARQVANDSLLAKTTSPDYRMTDIPNLMLGLAGIGHFLLRMHEPKIASVPTSKEDPE